MRALMLALIALLAACVAPRPSSAPAALPELRLAPASLGRNLALQQRLEFHHGGRTDSVDALLEIDAQHLKLVLHRHGQVALRLEWDGATLQERRAAGVPPQLQAARVLTDLQLVLWPVDVLRTALPSGWSLDAGDGWRELRQQHDRVLRIDYYGEYHARLRQQRDGYVLDLRSQIP